MKFVHGLVGFIKVARGSNLIYDAQFPGTMQAQSCTFRSRPRRVWRMHKPVLGLFVCAGLELAGQTLSGAPAVENVLLPPSRADASTMSGVPE